MKRGGRTGGCLVINGWYRLSCCSALYWRVLSIDGRLVCRMVFVASYEHIICATNLQLWIAALFVFDVCSLSCLGWRVGCGNLVCHEVLTFISKWKVDFIAIACTFSEYLCVILCSYILPICVLDPWKDSVTGVLLQLWVRSSVSCFWKVLELNSLLQVFSI